MIRRCENEIENMYEDIVGNFEEEEYMTALILARNMLLIILKIFLFSKNESVDRDKWIVLKVKDMAQNDMVAKKIYDKYKKLVFEKKIYTGDEYKENVEEIVRFSNRTMYEIRSSMH